MYMEEIKSNIITEPRFDKLFVKVRFFTNTLIILFLSLTFSSLVQADGLFDFQMKLAKSGNAEAQYKVGDMYETGFGVKKNQAEAMAWTQKAASKGHETAGFKLLYWDVEKNGLKGENKGKVEALKKKANNGNPQAQYYMGKMHANGVGVKKSSKEAIGWLNKAALVGVLEAERELTTVRETQQINEQAWRAKEDKKKAQQKAKQDRERQAKLDQEKKQKAKKDAESKARADATAKQKAAEKAKADALRKQNQQKSYQAKLAAKKEAEAKKRKAQQQAQKNKKAAEEKKRKTEFESDPCSGKSARFLSTCR